MATVVLIRGLMRDKRHWNEFAKLLQKRLPNGHQVISLDILGNGDSVDSRGPLTIDEYAEELLFRLRQLTCDDCYIVGLSMGGMIALQMASLQAKSVDMANEVQIKGVAVLNASAANLSPWYQRFQLGAVFNAFRHRVKDPKVSVLEAMIIASTSVTQGRNLHLVLKWTQYRTLGHTHFSNVLRQLWACRQFNCPAKIATSITVMSGLKDKLVSPNCSQKLARYYRSKLVEFDCAGHDLSLDCPEKLCQMLIERFFLNS
ncbi:alpha/beta hydrolase [Shewanella schlegeliana]|uniref:Alpha/beta hydrolase n=1 Tax=Shewanella schlegeliana TaxID=190308 RepID=A0ABS1SYT4_9GAMM|nr:alpha/beta hydrolase [Shewanella schlegeliana]MBL4913710.1 alpha/beta hydrolase [Shewanella schlegeliana]MCL1111573.1 alpha/beta hydrolase [Shewanella schlegeliana]GIU36808.1 alpha/beta hydrolase [Shewanella schlegeliana]